MKDISDKNIESSDQIISPKELKKTVNGFDLWPSVVRWRKVIEDILDGTDKRKLLIVGPCSIHNVDEAERYAHRLNELRKEVEDTFFIVMRTQFEKPRTIGGWEGFIPYPHLSETYDLEYGLKQSRALLVRIGKLGLPTATEFLGFDTPQYIGDLITYAAIGARTTESQLYRSLASGLSMPVGFKNNTDGNITIAIDAVEASRFKRTFRGINEDGVQHRFTTTGNKYTHVVLRGGSGGPNYYKSTVDETLNKLKERGLPQKLIIDCSHGNSRKDPNKQIEVFYDVIGQMTTNPGIVGLMIESNMHGGKQEFPKTQYERENLKPGVSITDACIPFVDLEIMIREGHEILYRPHF